MFAKAIYIPKHKNKYRNDQIIIIIRYRSKTRYFVKTQNCVGTALALLRSAMGMLFASQEEGVARLKLIEHVGDSGRLLSDIFNQQSVDRK